MANGRCRHSDRWRIRFAMTVFWIPASFGFAQGRLWPDDEGAE